MHEHAHHRSSLGFSPGLALLLGSVVAALGAMLAAAPAVAAPTKVAVIGAQMVHSDMYQRSEEWPAMLQKMVGAEFDVQNFGDCCSSVSLDYPQQKETHPYLRPFKPNRAQFIPGYNESITYMPDIVIIGPWGKHDRELTTQVFGGKLDPVKFAADYEMMIAAYQSLPSHPRIFASLPVPIPFGMPMGVVNDVVLPATKMVLAKHPEITVIDLWTPFLNHKELFIQDTGDRAGTHVTKDVGLPKIAEVVFGVWKTALAGGADAGVAVDAAVADDVAPPAVDGDGSGGTGGRGTGGSGASGGSGGGGSGGSSVAGSGGDGGGGGSGGTTGGSSGSGSGGSTGGSHGGGKTGGSSTGGCTYGATGGPAGLLTLLGLALLMRRRR